jgi:endonuclease/exonuclease/phosphatase family metal-dependent hydrolase
MNVRTLGILGAAALAAACASTTNYPDPAGPRYSGVYTKASVPRERGLRVVTFNIKYARETARAAALLKDDPRLSGADVIALQEMDEAGADLIARTLGVNFVYYPAVVHPANRRNFGDAVLSPWPLEDDVKIVLPHRGRFRKSVRIAVGATVRPPGREPVRVYSVHLETPAGISGRSRRDQAAAIIADAAKYPRVIVAGDFNSRSILEQAFAGSGFRWLTRNVGPTISRFSWDHVAAKCFRLRDCASVGTIANARDISDHRPVWADVLSDEEARAVAAPECP